MRGGAAPWARGSGATARACPLLKEEAPVPSEGQWGPAAKRRERRNEGGRLVRTGRLPQLVRARLCVAGREIGHAVHRDEVRRRSEVRDVDASQNAGAL